MKNSTIIKKAFLKTFKVSLRRITIWEILSLITVAFTLFVFISDKNFVKQGSLVINKILSRLFVNPDINLEWATCKLIIELCLLLLIITFIINILIEIRKADKFILNAPRNLKEIFSNRIGFRFKSIHRYLTILNLNGDYTVRETHNIEVTKGSVGQIPYFVYFQEGIRLLEEPSYEINYHPPDKKPDIGIRYEPSEKPTKITYIISFKNELVENDTVSYSIKYSIREGFLADISSILDKLKEGKYETEEPVEFFGELSTLVTEELVLRADFPKGFSPKSYWGKYHMVFYGFSKNHNKMEEDRIDNYVKKLPNQDGSQYIIAHIPEPLIGHKYLLIWGASQTKGLKI